MPIVCSGWPDPDYTRIERVTCSSSNIQTNIVERLPVINIKRRAAILTALTVLTVPLLSRAGLNEDFAAQESQLNQAAAQARTLSDELAVLDSQTALKEQRAASAEAEVNRARAALARLNAKLDTMNRERLAAIDQLSKYVRAEYLQQIPDEYSVIGSDRSLRQNLSLLTYLGGLEDSAGRSKQQITDRQRDIDQQRDQAIKLADQLTEAERTADRERADLAAVRSAKEVLLKQTQGQEDLFRTQYELLRDQLEATGAFARNARQRVASRVWDDSGFYFNQLDSRWIDARLGFSDTSTIGDYGCGLTSLAMVYTYYGQRLTPSDLNGRLTQTGAFVDDLMNWRNAAAAFGGGIQLATSPYPVGRQYVSWSQIDSQLAGGNPVIVYVARPGQINHYVVLLEKRGSGYIMHDPVEGPFQDFGRYYQTGNVEQAISFRKT